MGSEQTNNSTIDNINTRAQNGAGGGTFCKACFKTNWILHISIYCAGHFGIDRWLFLPMYLHWTLLKDHEIVTRFRSISYAHGMQRFVQLTFPTLHRTLCRGASSLRHCKTLQFFTISTCEMAFQLHILLWLFLNWYGEFLKCFVLSNMIRYKIHKNKTNCSAATHILNTPNALMKHFVYKKMLSVCTCWFLFVFPWRTNF